MQAVVYSNIFISFCALMMTWETLHYANAMNLNMLMFVFFATLLTYHFHSLINIVYPAFTKRSLWNAGNRRLIVMMMILAMAGTLYFFLPFAGNPLPFLVAGLLTFLYSAPNLKGDFFVYLRSIAIGKTLYLAGMWTFVTAILPMMATPDIDKPLPLAFIAYRFFLVYPICILFDRRDQLEDREKGIRALPTLLGDKALQSIYISSLVLSLAFAIAFTWPSFNVTTLMLLLPVLLCFPLYHFSRHRSDEFLYYVILDGLLMLSAILQAIYLISFTFVTR